MLGRDTRVEWPEAASMSTVQDRPAAPALATDPACGMRVDPARAPHRHEHAGETYHFCGAGCRAKFAADPGRYLGDRQATHACHAHGTTVSRFLPR